MNGTIEWLLIVLGGGTILGIILALVFEGVKAVWARAAEQPYREPEKPWQFSKYDLSALRTELPAWDIRFGDWAPDRPPDGNQNTISGLLKGTESRHGPGQGPVVFTFWRSRYETVEEAFEQAIDSFNDAQREYGHLREKRS